MSGERVKEAMNGRSFVAAAWWSCIVMMSCVMAPSVAAAQTASEEAERTFDKEGLLIENGTTLGYVGDNDVTPRESWLGEDDNRAFFSSDLTLQYQRDTFKFGGVVDFRLYPASPERPLATSYDFGSHMNLNRIWLRYRLNTTRILFGDFAFSLGKGIAFAVGKDDARWTDTAVRGAGLEYSADNGFGLSLFGGATNAANVDPVTGSVLDADPGDGVIALQVQYQLLEALRFGAHALHVEPRYDNVSDVPADRLWVDMGPGIRNSLLGALAELRLGGVSFYLEGNLQIHDNFRIIEPSIENDENNAEHNPVLDESGAAVYAELAWDSGPRVRRANLKMSLEGMYYHHFLAEGTYRSAFGAYAPQASVTYHRMPTLEPEWVTIRSLGNALGGRLETSLLIKRSDTRLILASNVIQYEGGVGTDGTWSSFAGVRVVHPTLTMVQKGRRGKGSAELIVGGRYETTDTPMTAYDLSGYLFHGGLSVTARIQAEHELTLSSRLRRHRLGVMERNDDFWVSDNSVAYSFARHWQVRVVLQYSNELEGGDKNVLQLGTWRPFKKNWFPQAQLTYQGEGIFQSFTAVLEGGATRGGYECVHGICRQFPDTVGALVGVRYQL